MISTRLLPPTRVPPPTRVNPFRHTQANPCGQKNGQCSPGRPAGRLGAAAQLCAPRTLCCEAFELLRFRPGPVQPSSGPKSTRPAPSPQWAHQSNLGRASAQRCPALAPDGANPFCTTAVPPRGWSIRAVPNRPGHWRRGCRQDTTEWNGHQKPPLGGSRNCPNSIGTASGGELDSFQSAISPRRPKKVIAGGCSPSARMGLQQTKLCGPLVFAVAARPWRQESSRDPIVHTSPSQNISRCPLKANSSFAFY